MNYRTIRAFLLLLGMSTVAGIFITSISDNNKEYHDSFKKAKTILCPTAYKFIHGDGYTSFDRSTPLVRTVIKVTLIKDGYIYDDKNNAFKMQECIIKD